MIAFIDIFNFKKKYCFIIAVLILFNMLLLIIYLSAIETLICRREMSLIRSTSFGFAQNTIHGFQKYPSELIVALSSSNARIMSYKADKEKHFYDILDKILIRS